MGRYVKAVALLAVSVLGALVVALQTGATDFGDISTKSWLVAAGTIVGSTATVWWAENGPAAPAIKAVLAFLGAAVGSLVIALDDDVLSQAEKLTALSVAIGATVAVFQLKNDPPG